MKKTIFSILLLFTVIGLQALAQPINHVLYSLPNFTENALWNKAVSEQNGMIGSDYRGKEYIGPAAFQRDYQVDGVKTAIGWVLTLGQTDRFNFWIPQKLPGENDPYYKRTLSGNIKRHHIAEVEKVYPDHDLNIDIVPLTNYQYLISQAHKPERVFLTKVDQKVNDAPPCPNNFTEVEAEIDTQADVKELMNGMLSEGQLLTLYGPWIYDKGHCCHPEIHPAEQIWWMKDKTCVDCPQTYYCALICDGSQRFWWRNQMDGDNKMKPWGAPPIKGTFAIAFETEIGKPAQNFVVNTIDANNVKVISNSNKVYNLVFGGNTLVSFNPNSNNFTVTFEKVGILPGTNKIRGFLVLETTVGKVTQIATRVTKPILGSNSNLTINIPQGSDPNLVDQSIEEQVFKKEEGHYIFSIVNESVRGDVNIRYLKSQGKGEIYSKNGSYIATHSNWRTSWQNIVKYGDLHLFYDRAAGIGEVYSFDQQNINRLVKSYSNWRRSWDIVTTCPAGILFYEPTGHAEIYSLNSDGSMILKKTHNGWRSSWKNIVMIDCDRSVGDDVCAPFTMLFYDPIAHTGEFWNMSADGNIILKKTHTSFRSTWQNIVALDNSKVLFYDRTNNLIEIYYVDGQGNMALRKSYPNWEKPLTDITFLRGGILLTTTDSYQLLKYRVAADGTLTKI